MNEMQIKIDIPLKNMNVSATYLPTAITSKRIAIKPGSTFPYYRDKNNVLEEYIRRKDIVIATSSQGVNQCIVNKQLLFSVSYAAAFVLGKHPGSGYVHWIEQESSKSLHQLREEGKLTGAAKNKANDSDQQRSVLASSKVKKAGKQNVKQSESIPLTKKEYQFFEGFFQYGNLKQAKIVFVGMEEGLGRVNIDEMIASRFRWCETIPNVIETFSTNEGIRGFYLNDLDTAAWHSSKKKFNDSREEYREKLEIDSTMSYQARIKELLDTNFVLLQKNDRQQRKAIRDCFFDTLHKLDSDTAMIDIYPLPKQGNFPYRVEGLPFHTEKEYIAFNNDQNNPRRRLITYMYETFPMDVSIVYAGISKREYKLRSYYEDVLGFDFLETVSTRLVPSSYLDLVVPETKNPKTILIGKRIRNDGHVQYAILTPFFGVGQTSKKDIDVIAAWTAEKLK